MLSIGVLFFVEWWDFTLPAPGGAAYQAVFLSNGQTYFGRYSDRLGPYVKLSDVYYLQQAQRADESTPADLRMVRRGSELHTPRGTVLIPKTAILFVEDLQQGSPFGQFMDQRSGR